MKLLRHPAVRRYGGWMKGHWVPVLMYVGFTGSVGVYLKNAYLYRDIGHWPSVPASEIRSQDFLIPFEGDPRMGNGGGGHFISTNTTTFTYTVAGKIYRGGKASPDDEPAIEFSFQIAGEPPPTPPVPQAYDSPQRPEVAVLNPVPYKGSGLRYIAGVCGLLIAAHLYFSLRRDF